MNEQQKPKLDLSNHGLNNPTIVADMYVAIFTEHTPYCEPWMWQEVAAFDAVKADMARMDRIITLLKQRGETEQAIRDHLIKLVNVSADDAMKAAIGGQS